MHRPGGARPRRVHGAGAARGAGARPRTCSASAARSRPRTSPARAPRLPELRSERRAARSSAAGARRSANRALREVDEGTGADAYWRAADVEAHRRHRGRARWRTSSSRSSSSSSSTRPARRPDTATTQRRRRSSANTPAAAAGLRGGRPRRRRERARRRDVRRRVSTLIRASHGTPITVTVERGGTTVTLGPRDDDQRRDGRWIWGFVPAARARVVPARARARAWRRTTAGTSSPGPCTAFGAALPHEGARRSSSSTVGIVRDLRSRRSRSASATTCRSSASMSMSLALLNLLPLLPLDGGHILVLAHRGASAAARSRARSTSASPSSASR